MLKLIQNLKFKYKLFACFLTVILINAFAGLFSYSLINQISKLVYTTYDKALMSGTFSQQAKAEFYQFELAVYDGLLAKTDKDIKRASLKAKRSMETLREDLEIVKERALDPKIIELANEVNQDLIEIVETKDRFFATKEREMPNSMKLIDDWNTKTNSKKLARKLTRISDEAAVIGYEFRLESEKKNNESIRNLLIVAAACLLLAVIFAFVTSSIIVKPLMKLKEACLTISKGSYSTRAPIDSKDEVGSLAKSFNSMLDVIEEKDRNLNSLLSALPFGLFYFDKHGKISQERSQITDKMFAGFNKYDTLDDFFLQFGVSNETIKKVIDVIYQNLLPFSSAGKLFPSRVEVIQDNGNRLIDLTFKKHAKSDDSVERVIVIAEDVTKKVEAYQKNKMLNERVDRISKASDDTNGFKEFSKSCMSLFSDIQNKANVSDKDLTALKRDLHSLKGLVEVYGFSTASEQIHELETILAKNMLVDCREDFLGKLNCSESLFKEYVKDLEVLLALDQSDDFKTYSKNKIDKIRSIATKLNNQDLSLSISDLEKFPIDRLLKKYRDYTDQILRKMKDKKAQLIFSRDADELTYDEVKLIDPALIHILRNSIDHGMEPSAQRLDQSKPELGSISLNAKRLQGFLTLEISDDGKGIDPEILSKKAVEKGVWTEAQMMKASKDEKISLIFAPSFSSKDDVSEISGRGVGMDAVKDLVEQLGGSIEVYTEIGKGTRFTLKIPTEHS